MASTAIPEKFFGTFKLEKSEKFDEYLAAKGVNWLVRKMIQMSSITKIIEKSTEQPNAYNFTNLSPKINLEYKNFKLGEEFQGKGYDNEHHKVKLTTNLFIDCFYITFDVPNENTLSEHRVRLDNDSEEGATYYYSIEGDYLVMTMTHDAIECKRFMKRI